jgi:hypothetical protein
MIEGAVGAGVKVGVSVGAGVAAMATEGGVVSPALPGAVKETIVAEGCDAAEKPADGVGCEGGGSPGRRAVWHAAKSAMTNAHVSPIAMNSFSALFRVPILSPILLAQ